jgi:SulP family sulfate permease
MLSAAIIPIITSALGGTPVQTSGPTAPMSTLTAVLVAFAYDDFVRLHPEYPAEQFISLAIFATAVILLLAAALRLGRFILLVPNLVASGFMNGIAVLIWWDILGRLGGFSEKAYGGGPTVNVLLGLLSGARKRLVSHRQMLVIAGTTLVTVAVNLNVAVILFTILFYLLWKLGVVYDLSLAKMEGLEDEP